MTYYDETGPIFNSEVLEEVPTYTAEPTKVDEEVEERPLAQSRRLSSRAARLTPGREILCPGLRPIESDFVLSTRTTPESLSDRSSVTADQMEGVASEGRSDGDRMTDNELAANSLQHTAAAGLAETERDAQVTDEIANPTLTIRVDSVQGEVPQVPLEKRTARGKSPLRVHTPSNPQAASSAEDTIATSPTLRKHAIRVAEGTANTIPPVQPTSPAQEGMAGLPTKGEQLPSFRQLTNQIGQLSELAEVAVTQPYSHHSHKQSFSSTTSQSPRLAYHPYPGSVQTSPISYNTFTAISPTSTVAESQQYGSPPMNHTPLAYFTDQRPSVANDAGPPFPASMPSASSSGESHGGHAGSSTDGYPSSHTTPVDQPSLDGSARPHPPPPQGMPINGMGINGGFKCDYDGCEAVPFQTQYLLSSHRNVHSQNRPHYCPVADCTRSEGGKGFKRKNEMIRHGLVHNSPGYVCPFCSDREHRYPRPDNLQRHVRVHHPDRDRDDLLLRDVLGQRIEGTSKQRRRRANTAVASA